jgi:uncharacterized protein (DUF58 family)
MALLGLSLLLWFLGEWFVFALRVYLAIPSVRFARRVLNERGPVDALWAGRSFRVAVQYGMTSWLGLPFVRIRDRVPYRVERRQGMSECEFSLSAGDTGLLEYEIRCPVAGMVRFEGISIQTADAQGFFYYATFFAQPFQYRVLPPLADTRGRRPTLKRYNLLPSPGMHRHQRPGSGSELLDLRDYLPGDPPKTIAWKVSARRDRLITKVYESEVPVRCTFFVDASQSVRVGSLGGNALAKLTEIAAAAAQAATSARDLAGLQLVDEDRVLTTLRPARGHRHIVKMLNALAEAASMPAATGAARLETLLPLGYAFAQEVYPDLLRQDVNQVPGWYSWFWPMPSGQRRRGVGGWLWRGLLWLTAAVPLLIFALFCYLFADFLYEMALLLLGDPPDWLLGVVGGGLVTSFALLYYGMCKMSSRFWLLFFATRHRRLTVWRKPLAALLSERRNLAPGGLALLLEDDERFVLEVQEFLAEHQVPYPVPMYDGRGRYLFASAGKVAVLARALLRAIARGRDNELFVLMVDLLELSSELHPLIRAVKVALARHHQIIVICPWPPGIPAPGKPMPAVKPGISPAAMTQPELHALLAERLNKAFVRMRQQFARLSVPVVCAESGDPVRLILERVERLRAAGLGKRR